MALFGGPARAAETPTAEERAAYLIPSLPLPSGTFSDFGPVTGTTAVQAVAIRTTQDLIASLASELPVHVFTGRGQSRREVPTPANILDPGGDDTGTEDWIYRLVTSWLSAGNQMGTAVAWDGFGRARQVDLVNTADVTATVVDGAPKWWISGKPVEGDALRNFVHWRVNPVAGRLLGLSPIEQHAATIGVALSATRFGRQWFSDGAHPSGLMRNTVKDLSPTEAEDAKRRILEKSRGMREPLVMGRGWEWADIQVSPEESQFLETQKFTAAECARIYGPGFAEILGYETGGSMTYANIVDRRQDLLVLSMNKWLRRVERVLSSLVPRPQYVQLNRDALLESTTLQRYQAHTEAISAGWKLRSEVREIEGLPPIQGIDDPTPSGGM